MWKQKQNIICSFTLFMCEMWCFIRNYHNIKKILEIITLLSTAKRFTTYLFLVSSYMTWLRYYQISCDFILSLLEDIFPGWHAPTLITTEHNLQRWNRSSLRPSAPVWMQSCYGLYLLSLFFRDCAKTKLMIESISQASLLSLCQLKVWPLRADESPKINLCFLWQNPDMRCCFMKQKQSSIDFSAGHSNNKHTES